MFQQLNECLHEISGALRSINGKLGTVKIANVLDASEVERAVAEIEDIVDSRLSQRSHHPTVTQLADKMKADYRQKIVDAVEVQKDKLGGHRPTGTSSPLPAKPAQPPPTGPPGRWPNPIGFPTIAKQPFASPSKWWGSSRPRKRGHKTMYGHHDTHSTISAAIQQQIPIVATYNGHRRVMCPHALGTKRGRGQCLCYQIAGSSNSGLSVGGEWRCLVLAKLSEVHFYPGQWYSGSSHSTPHT